VFVNVELIYNNTYKFIQFTYKVPREYENKVYIGTIVELLFRNKKYKALVVDINVKKPNTKKINEIQNVLFTLTEEQITFLTYLSVSNYLNIGILLSEIFNIEKYKEQKKHKSKLIKQYTQSDIGNNISKKNKNIFVTPTLESSNQLSKELIAKGLDLDFYQKTGGREEIESFVNSNIDFKNIVILSNNFNYFNITDDVVFHFYDTNNISYKLPKLNGVNIIELAILKQKIFGGNFRFYNIFPALDMFDSYDHYEEVIIKNDITYIYGNNFEECINILKNKFQYDKCIPYTNSEILKNELNEYKFTDNLLSKDTDVYFLFNPKLSYKNTLNSLRLISLIKDVQHCEYINIPIVLISTKDQDLQEMLKLNNIKNLANNELRERSKYGPNINTKIFTLSSDNEIETEKYNDYLLGPRKEEGRFEYEIRLILSKNINYNKIMDLFSYTNIHNPTKSRNI